MFSVEIKINGSMIRHIYGHNKGFVPITKENEGMAECKYEGAVYDVEHSKMIPYTVIHNRAEGIDELIMKILTEVKGK